eukprot:TRINITY_DN5775_c0_g2_i1.p1 TRINITY_DN5775_c0_g2~~TRINITY_DN5775_c0_g2_i1.p1  ORF type:complete len:112 (-),score=16.86 TRINITY_DN5775_c0_g2_i1:93-428(-)
MALMIIKQKISLSSQVIIVFQKAHLHLLMELFIMGKIRQKKYYENLFEERKEVKFKTEELLGFGHRCIIRWECKWINENGTEDTIRGIDIIKEKNDLIGEMLSYSKSSEFD